MGIESDLESVLAAAVRFVGSQSAFARLIGRSQTWVFNALRDDKPLPGEHVAAVERETGISRHDLRPDLYPRDAAPARAGRGDQLEPVR